MKYEKCKTINHWWEEYNPPQGEWDGYSIHVATDEIEFMRCVRECGGTRMFQLDASGYVLSRNYHMPVDYPWDYNMGEKPSRSEMRMTRLKKRNARPAKPKKRTPAKKAASKKKPAKKKYPPLRSVS